MSFSENLKEALDFRGMQIKELSAKTGISKNTIDNYLSGQKSLPNVEVCRSHWTTIEVNGKGVNKGLACRKIAEAYGLKDDEVVVCGDGGNDLAMMKEFPIPLAPAGAEDKIKEAAWEVCASVEEGGICGRLIEMIEEGQ